MGSPKALVEVGGRALGSLAADVLEAAGARPVALVGGPDEVGATLGRALREMARVTKLGGRIAILELSEPGGGLLGAMARFHVHTLVPRIGALISGAREYRYLQQSIAAFPPASTFAQQLSECGLKVLQVTPLTFGVCHLYVAEPSSN